MNLARTPLPEPNIEILDGKNDIAHSGYLPAPGWETKRGGLVVWRNANV
jgi:hypothetical protein